MLDPVDPKRNLGTAVSLQNLHKFIYISKKFLDNPLNSSFTKNKHKINSSYGLINCSEKSLKKKQLILRKII